jgi:hypothetical protein
MCNLFILIMSRNFLVVLHKFMLCLQSPTCFMSVGTPHSSTLHPSHITAAHTRCLATKTAPCTFLPPCNPPHITAALTRCYSKPRLPTLLPSQWRGRPASRAQDKRRELPEQDSFTPQTSSHSIVVNHEEQSTARLIKKKEETTTSRLATMPRGPGSASPSSAR